MSRDDDFGLGQREGDAAPHRVANSDGVLRNHEGIIESDASKIGQEGDHFCPIFFTP